jgi:peroxiredoxin
MTRLTCGTQIKPYQLLDVRGHSVNIPKPGHWTHLQFRRYSGCAVCNLHLRSFITGYKDLTASRIQEVVIFNSTPARITADLPECPLAVISDVDKQLYRDFGVGTAIMAVFNPAVWIPALRGAAQYGVQLPRDQETSWGLPADFLVDEHGKLVAVHYGKHANDQWSFDQLLERVKREGVTA